METLHSSCLTVDSQSIHGVKFVLEGLFAHFFSPDKSSYHHEDILLLLKLINEQKELMFEDEKGGISAAMVEVSYTGEVITLPDIVVYT